jgi:D-sedoheptulose 7-phosphate isomerase
VTTIMLSTHLTALHAALDRLDLAAVDAMGGELSAVLARGGRLLVAGNGGSAAHAQHLTAELVGRYVSDARSPYSALALHAETSSVTAIANDYGWDEVFARQVRAHGRPGDVFLGISTSGGSVNVLRAAEAARRGGLDVWALTGPGPNPLLSGATRAIAVAGDTTATVQEVHQVVVHLLCEVVDRIAIGVSR